MVAVTLYIIAGLLAAPMLGHLLLGDWRWGMVPLVVLGFIYGMGATMAWCARHPAPPTWKPEPRWRKRWLQPGITLTVPLPPRHEQIEAPEIVVSCATPSALAIIHPQCGRDAADKVSVEGEAECATWGAGKRRNATDARDTGAYP